MVLVAVPILEYSLVALGVMTLIFLVLLGILRVTRSHSLSPDVWRLLLAVAEKAVMAVEQVHGDRAGMDKKRLAEDLVAELLLHFGLRVPRPVMEAAVESAVLVMNAVVHGRGARPASAKPKGVA